MKYIHFILALCSLSLLSCRGSKYGQYTDDEVTVLKVSQREPISLETVRTQEDVHNSKDAYASRGLFDSYGSTAAGLVVSGVKQLIENEKEKYNADYDFIIEPNGRHIQNDSSYFYSGTSDIPFNPTNIQFKGFTVTRICGTDTALKAVFELDTSNLTELFFDGVFRLKLTELKFNYAKAKVPAHGDHRVNLDFTIDFYSSWVSAEGQLNNNVKIGSFTLNLPAVYLHNTDSAALFNGSRLNGYSFIVPRSYGYSAVRKKAVYNQGAYAVHVNVKETATLKVVNQFISDHSDYLLDNINSGSNN